MGYDRFLAVGAEAKAATGQFRTRFERASAMSDALSAHGLDFEQINIDHETPTVAELRELLKFRISPANRTLIFVENQWALPRVFQALEPSRHLIPDRLGILGLNCTEWTDLTAPTISTVVEPVRQEGRMACQMLVELLEGSEKRPRQEILACHTRWLGSTK